MRSRPNADVAASAAEGVMGDGAKRARPALQALPWWRLAWRYGVLPGPELPMLQRKGRRDVARLAESGGQGTFAKEDCGELGPRRKNHAGTGRRAGRGPMSLEKSGGTKAPGPRDRAETLVHLARLFSTSHATDSPFFLCYKIMLKALVL